MSRFLLNKNFLSLILISIPFLSFANANFHAFDFIFFRSVFFILFFAVVVIFLSSKSLSLFLKKLDYKIFSFVLSFVFFALFYLFPFFKGLLIYTAPIYNAEISLVLSIFFLTFFSFFFFDQEHNFFKRFILIYLFICFVANISIFIFNTTIFLLQKIPTDATILIDETGIEYLKKNKTKNMYFVIVDGAIALDKFDKYYKTNHFSSYTSKFKKLGFNYVKNTKSVYPSTLHVFTSLFYLDYHVTEKNYKKYLLTNLFPAIMQKKNADKLPLIKNLKKINYKFKWFGPSSYNCKTYNLDFCLKDTNKLPKKKFITPDVAKTFLQRGPLIQIYEKINSFLGMFLTLDQIFIDFKENDSLGRFVSRMNNFKLKNQGYFFFIHSLVPHQPYVFNSDCSIKKGLGIMTDKEKIELHMSSEADKTKHMKSYKENYECMLKRVDEFISFINKNDPEANVIITSDHGHNIKNFYHLRYDTFVLVKVNKECQQNVSDNLNVTNGVRLILGCTVGQKFSFLERKSYWVDFEKGNFTIGGQLRLEKLDPDNYYEFIKDLFDTGRV